MKLTETTFDQIEEGNEFISLASLNSVKAQKLSIDTAFKFDRKIFHTGQYMKVFKVEE